MSNSSTSSTLILVGEIFHLIASIFWLVLGSFMLIPMFNSLRSPYPSLALTGVMITVPVLTLEIIGCIIFFKWHQWRHAPGLFKNKLIVTGVVSIIFYGIIGGILTTVGGAIVPTGYEGV